MKLRSILTLCGTALLLATNATADTARRPGLREYKIRDAGKWSYVNPRPDLFFQTPGRIVNAPYAANAYIDWDLPYGQPRVVVGQYTNPDWWPPNTATEAQAPYGGWNWSDTFVYSGFINIPADSNTVAFVISFLGDKRLFIDDVPVAQSSNYGEIVTAGVQTFTPGPHKFELWLDNNMNECGPFGLGAWHRGNMGQWHPDRIGFGIDWTGTGNTTMTGNYEFPIDDGMGSLFYADPPPGYIRVRTVAAEEVRIDNAKLTGYIILGEGHPGVVRVYYDLQDHGNDYSELGWGDNFVEEDSARDADGVFEHLVAIPVGNLLTGQKYHFRFAFTNDFGTGIHMAPNTLTFTPIDYYTPARFDWGGGATDWVWGDPAGWVNKDGLARPVPGDAVGDTLEFTDTPAGNRVVRLTNDVTIAGITAGFSAWQNRQIQLLPGSITAPVTNHLQTLDGSAFNVNNTGVLEIFFGPSATATRDLLVFNLHQSAAFNHNYGAGHGNVYLNSPVTGGVPGCTLGFYNNRTENIDYRVHIRNSKNTFIGDIIVNRPEANYRMIRFYFGDNTGGVVTDGVFGHPSNRVISQNAGNNVTINAPSGGFLFNRTFTGLGTLRCVSVANTDLNSDTPRAFTIGSNGRLEPGLGNALGNLTVFASTLAFDPAAVVKIKVKANGTSDKLNLMLRANSVWSGYNNTVPPTPGTLTLGGKVEFDELEHIRSGTSWVIGQTSYTNTILTAGTNFKSATPNYVITPVRDPDGTLRIIATKVSAGALLMVR